MNIANKLTLLRVILVFVFMGVIWLPLTLSTNVMLTIALSIFIIASITDFLDGYLARRLNLITNLGKFMDPLADKMLVTAAMLAVIDLGSKQLLPSGDLPTWIVVTILLREFMVSGVRLIAANDNHVIAASNLGKIKTVIQMAMIVVYLLPLNMPILPVIAIILAYLALILTVASGMEYLWKNKAIFKI